VLLFAGGKLFLDERDGFLVLALGRRPGPGRLLADLRGRLLAGGGPGGPRLRAADRPFQKKPV
jgi:hypothetical protein